MYILPTVVYYGIVALLLISIVRTINYAWMLYREEEEPTIAKIS